MLDVLLLDLHVQVLDPAQDCLVFEDLIVLVLALLLLQLREVHLLYLLSDHIVDLLAGQTVKIVAQFQTPSVLG